MSYSSASDVAALCRNLIAPSKAFTLSTCPTLTEVNTWLSSGCSQIELKLATCGYSTPAASGTVIYDHLGHLNTIYAAGWAHNSRMTATVTADERVVGDRYLSAFKEGLGELCENDLTLAGLSRVGSRDLYAGGISVSDKQRQEADTDRVSPRFFRNIHTFPGTIDPSATTASSP